MDCLLFRIILNILLCKHSTGITLVALNTAVFQPTFFTNEEVISLPVTIQGKVIELRAKF